MYEIDLYLSIVRSFVLFLQFPADQSYFEYSQYMDTNEEEINESLSNITTIINSS